MKDSKHAEDGDPLSSCKVCSCIASENEEEHQPAQLMKNMSNEEEDCSPSGMPILRLSFFL